jgi:hypothetical protein
MTDLLHSDLSADQRARVVYLFVDEFFGTDPSAFNYEVDQRGVICGRRTIDAPPGTDRVNKMTWLFDHIADQVIEQTELQPVRLTSDMEIQS